MKIKKRKYTLETKTVNKVTITISRRVLWENFASCYFDIVWTNQEVDIGMIDVVGSALLGGTLQEKRGKIAFIFSEAYTPFLLGPAMEEFGNRDVIEIVITDPEDKSTITINNDEIDY